MQAALNQISEDARSAQEAHTKLQATWQGRGATPAASATVTAAGIRYSVRPIYAAEQAQLRDNGNCVGASGWGKVAPDRTGELKKNG